MINPQHMIKEKTIKYIAVEKDTPDVPRARGEGKTDLIARLQCEIALREKLIGKFERGCTEGVCSTHRYFIESETDVAIILLYNKGIWKKK